MQRVKLYSQRLAESTGVGCQDIFEYNKLPEKFITQLHYLLRNTIGDYQPTAPYGSQSSDYDGLCIYSNVIEQICEEHALIEFIQGETNRDSSLDLIIRFLRLNNNNVIALDLTERLFFLLENNFKKSVIKRRYTQGSSPLNSQKSIEIIVSEAIHLLNERFKQNNFGFRYEDGILIRIDSEYIHSEATRPALTLLNTSLFEKAHSLFLEAHHKLLKGELVESLVSANKSFEATLRIIIKAKGWNDPSPPVASKLVDECLSKGLIPPYLKAEIDSFRGLFSQGVPAIRNFKAGHAELPDESGKHPHGELTTHLCQYALNLAASHIVFIVECYKDSESS
ncbi:STM4504/CBY_0614 family protein [Marinomonas primoryensis]|uniref:Abortive infection protein-like C-terminal domain-containing protein n=1 Tax=Marinomonas primoryensis TaxID=178399 RepID=A0ABV0KWW1_9GAMM